MYLKHALSPLPFLTYRFLILKMMNIRTAVLSQSIYAAIVRVVSSLWSVSFGCFYTSDMVRFYIFPVVVSVTCL